MPVRTDNAVRAARRHVRRADSPRPADDQDRAGGHGDGDDPEPLVHRRAQPGRRHARVGHAAGDPGGTVAAFRWASQFPGQDLAEGRTTLIEFFVAAEADAVTVKVRESGFSVLDASEDVRQAGLASNTDGWRMELAGLKERSEAAPAR